MPPPAGEVAKVNVISNTDINATPPPQPRPHPRTPVTFCNPQAGDDELGKLIGRATMQLAAVGDWHKFLEECRVEPPDLSPNVGQLDHPAAHLLKHIHVHGVPVTLRTPPWTKHQLDTAIQRGPHQSAKADVKFVREEFADFIKKKFWTVVPYRLVKGIPSLRLSPLGVVPQRDRRPRLLVDLSYFGVNDKCLDIAPSEAMQFGRTLQRLLQRILDADPKYGPVYLAKLDIADGFYRVRIAIRDVAKLGVLLPSLPGEEPMVAFPLVLPMGWVNSPPYFSAVTETAADLMNDAFKRSEEYPPHRLEDQALQIEADNDLGSRDPTHSLTEPTIHPPRLRQRLKYVDIYVDDFIALL